MESPKPRRLSTRVLLGLASLVLVALVALAWRLAPQRFSYYSDADTIRQPTDAVVPRDILWQPPKPLPDELNSVEDDYEPRISADGRTVFFVRGKAGRNADIFFARRTRSGWTAPQPVPAINSEYDDLGPEPSSDGERIYFYSNRPGGEGGYDLWVARCIVDGDLDAAITGADTSGTDEPSNLGPDVNSAFNDYGPALTPDGLTLYFASNRPRASDADGPNPDAWPATVREDLFQRDYDLYSARLVDGTLEAAGPVNALNSSFNEGAPAVSPVGDFLYFASDRPGGSGGFDLYRCRLRGGQHERLTNLGPEVNTGANELDPALTLGGFGLCFSSDRAKLATLDKQADDYDLYQTTAREVFRDVETLSAAPIDWAAFWAIAGPTLLWALLALLLLLLLKYLFGVLRHRRLSLLTKCLLTSLFLHLLTLLLMTAWGVSASLAGSLRGRAPIQVALMASESGDGIASQILAAITQVPPITGENPPMPATQAPAVSVAASAAPANIEPVARMLVSPASFAGESAPETYDQLRADLPVTPLSPQPRHVPAVATPNDQAPTPSPSAEPQPQVQPAMISERVPPPQVESGLTTASSMAQVAPMAVPRQPTTETMVTVEGIRPRGLEPRAADVVPPPPSVSKGQVALALPSESVVPSTSEAEPSIPATQTPIPASPPPAFSSATSIEVASPSLAQLDPDSRPPARTASIVRPEDSLNFASASVESRDLPVPSLAAKLPSLRPTMEQLALPTTDPQDLPSSDVAPPEAPRLALAAPPVPPRPMPATAISVHSAEPSTYHADPLPLKPPAAPVTQLAYSVHRDTQRLPEFLPSEAFSIIPKDSAQTPGLRLPTESAPTESMHPQRTEENRVSLIERLGGSKETEAAVASALKWLAAHQSANGSWSGEHFDARCGECGGETNVEVDAALTGLSLLCFLGADHTHTKPGPYQATVQRGLDWLLARQAKNGDLRGDESMYSQGIATIALTEAFGMTRDARLSRPAQRAVDFIVQARNQEVGGWRYDPGQVGDTSVLGWQVMALKSARMSGLSAPAEAFEAARDWLELVSRSQRRGEYAYQPGRPSTQAMIAEGMFSQLLLGLGPDDPKTRASADLIAQRLPDWDKALNTYYWYYATLALFQQQGSHWTAWNKRLTGELLRHQRKEGAAAGSWDPLGEWAATGGRVYQTAVCALMLEVYYRYLPMYSPVPSYDTIGVIRGTVLDAATGTKLQGASVRLDIPDGDPLVATTGSDGMFELGVPEVPPFFALTATAAGFQPEAVNVPSKAVRDTTYVQDFKLQPLRADVVAVEPIPEVHHLGDNHFEGKINSQFQKRAEGAMFRVEFEIDPRAVQRCQGSAELRMLVKGVQRKHPILINGNLLASPLDRAPSDGSFGEFKTAFDAGLLLEGANTLEIHSTSLGGDIDDFEFVNVELHLAGNP